MNGQPLSVQDDLDVRLRGLLADVLGLSAERVARFADGTALFGALPEFDSLAVANFLTGFEERFGVLIDDDAVAAEDFATFGRLHHLGARLLNR